MKMTPPSPAPRWVRSTSLGMLVVFVYVNIIYGAIEPANKFWQERKQSAQRLLDRQRTLNGETPEKTAGVPPPQATLLAQLPGVNLNLLPQASPQSRSVAPIGGLPSSLFKPDLKLTNQPMPKWFESVSANMVSLKDLYLPNGWKAGDFMVVHIQDAHGNVEAQRNIAKVIESIAQSGNVRSSGLEIGQESSHNDGVRPFAGRLHFRLLIGIEGAKGSFDFSPYRTFLDQEITKEIAEYFLKESLVTGPEYLGMTLGLGGEGAGQSSQEAGEPPRVQYWGVEDTDLYLSHIDALKASVSLQKEAKAKVEAMARDLEAVKDQELNADLRDLDRKIAQRLQGKIGLGEYLKYLMRSRKFLAEGAKQSQRNSLSQFMIALQLEESLDYRKVEEERSSLTRILSEKLPKSELENLVKASLSYRLGNLTDGALYQYLKDLCAAYGIHLSAWPEMDKYIRYVLLSDRIKPEDLFAEIGNLESRALESEIRTEKEREVMVRSKDLSLIEKLVGYELSPAEWREYQSRKGWIEKTVAMDAIRPFERFNEVAIARNRVLAENLLKKVAERPSDRDQVAVLVAGGFHTEGITQIFKDRKIAYVVLTPRLGKVEGTGTEYLDFQNYPDGYLRSFLGYALFMLMSVFFLSVGRLIAKFIFKAREQEPHGFSNVTWMEKISLYYLLGSLVASLLWLGLGSLSFLNSFMAYGVLGLGLVSLWAHRELRTLSLLQTGAMVKQKMGSWIAELDWIERILVLLIFVLLLLWSSFSIPPQSSEDVLVSNLAVPNYYVHEGRIATNPYHLYTYISQNTEMLTVWALLLKSEVAAVLVIWGFLAAFVLLIYGFVRRWTSHFPGLMASFLLMSVPVLIYQSIRLKNDVPLVLFIFAHYWALTESLHRSKFSLPESRKWMFLAGVLCGGALGHKYVAIPVAAISSATILWNDFMSRKRLASFWFAGIAGTMLPWIVRSFLTTGYPIYPFLITVWGGHLIKPWHSIPPQESVYYKGWGIVLNYFRQMLYSQKENLWGPSMLFGILALDIFRKERFSSFRIGAISAVLSWMGLLLYAPEQRWHIGMVAFLVCVPFAFCLDEILQGKYRKICQWEILYLALVYFHCVYSYAYLWPILRSSCAIALSGFAPGNFSTRYERLDNWLWISHLINTRTKDSEPVLCFEHISVYGLKQKIFFGSGGYAAEKTVIGDLAERSRDAEELRDRLVALGIRHIVTDQIWYQEYKNYGGQTRIAEKDLIKIKDLFERLMELHASSPDGELVWYSFRESEEVPSMAPELSDAIAYPRMFIDWVGTHLSAENAGMIRTITEQLVQSPMSVPNRLRAYSLLADIYKLAGDKVREEQAIFMAIKIAPKSPILYARLGLFCFQMGDFSNSEHYYTKTVQLDPLCYEAYNNLGATYYEMGQYERAIKQYHKALEIYPRYTEAYKNMAVAYYKMKQSQALIQKNQVQ